MACDGARAIAGAHLIPGIPLPAPGAHHMPNLAAAWPTPIASSLEARVSL